MENKKRQKRKRKIIGTISVLSAEIFYMLADNKHRQNYCPFREDMEAFLEITKQLAEKHSPDTG